MGILSLYIHKNADDNDEGGKGDLPARHWFDVVTDSCN